MNSIITVAPASFVSIQIEPVFRTRYKKLFGRSMQPDDAVLLR